MNCASARLSTVTPNPGPVGTSMVLSGFIFPIRSMPEPLQWITYAVPARYYLIALRGIILKGTDLSPYWDQATNAPRADVDVFVQGKYR